jgi:hypothetical protein
MVYTHRFLELKLEIHDMSDAEAKDKYMRGLKPHVSQKVRLENPDTLNEMIQIAQMFDEAVYNSRHAIRPCSIRRVQSRFALAKAIAAVHGPKSHWRICSLQY